MTQCLKDAPGVLVAASDYVKALPDSIDRWLPRPLMALGTDGFGRSENRASLREFFEVDHRYVVVATLSALARDGKIEASVVAAGDRDAQHQSGEGESGHLVGDDSPPRGREDTRRDLRGLGELRGGAFSFGGHLRVRSWRRSSTWRPISNFPSSARTSRPATCSASW